MCACAHVPVQFVEKSGLKKVLVYFCRLFSCASKQTNQFPTFYVGNSLRNSRKSIKIVWKQAIKMYLNICWKINYTLFTRVDKEFSHVNDPFKYINVYIVKESVSRFVYGRLNNNMCMCAFVFTCKQISLLTFSSLINTSLLLKYCWLIRMTRIWIEE